MPQPRATAPKRAPSVGIVSLGCPKALVDSERILTKLRSEGYRVSGDYNGADLVLVNTCGFLDTARAESLDAIGEALAEHGRVIVTGCLGAEADLIRAAHPGVLAITGPHQYENVMAAVHAHLPPKHDPHIDLVPPEGLRLTPRHYAYLKISEGCDNRCSFCIIPQLRGDLSSRPANSVLKEAEALLKAGVKEILVISQDTSAYGRDVGYAQSPWRGAPVKTRFLDLAQALGDMAAEYGAWVRLH
jgi:ribosomal protein S12 methylthiotransferase